MVSIESNLHCCQNFYSIKSGMCSELLEYDVVQAKARISSRTISKYANT